jgi:hypothetical protein
VNDTTLQHYLTAPDAMGAESIEELRRRIAETPYCAAYRVLLCMALGNVHSMQLTETLQQTAAHVPDRYRLLTLTNQGEAEWLTLLQRHQKPAEQPQKEANDFQLIERYLDHQGLPTESDKPLYDATEALSALPYTLQEEEETPEADPDDAQNALIDSFIEAERQGTLFVPESIPAETRTAEAGVEKIRDSAFLTESLAKIYIKQHKYSQALSIIRDLSLKYPEKNVYFADQIRFLEKIIAYKTNKTN